jgi:hypothetical protein
MAQGPERLTATPDFGGRSSGLLADLGRLVQLEVGDHAVVVTGHNLADGLVQDTPAIGDVQGGAVVAAAHQHTVDAPARSRLGSLMALRGFWGSKVSPGSLPWMLSQQSR